MREAIALMAAMVAGRALAPVSAQGAAQPADKSAAALPFADVQYRLVGPFRGARVGGVAGDRARVDAEAAGRTLTPIRLGDTKGL